MKWIRKIYTLRRSSFCRGAPSLLTPNYSLFCDLIFSLPCESIRKELSMEKVTAISPEKTLVRDCVETALLAVLIAVSGTFRIPGIVPGTEF